MTRNILPIRRLFKKLKTAAIATGAFCALAITSSLAVAAPISNASFGITGGFNLPAGSNLGNTNAIFITNGGMITVFAGDTMDLAGIVNVGNTGTLQDLPSLSSFSPITGFISLNSGVSVDLNTLHVISQSGPAPGFINISGDAVIHAPGFDPTSGALTFTGTTSDNTSFTLAVTTSASTPPAGVPEPRSLALLGLGLVALFMMNRKRTTGYQAI